MFKTLSKYLCSKNLLCSFDDKKEEEEEDINDTFGH